MQLTIYADEKFREVREVREVPRMKIPYRVGQYVTKLIDGMDLTDDQAVLRKMLDSEEQITAVVQATFGLDDEDLAYIDLMELGELAGNIINYVLDKIGTLREGTDPNAQAAAPTA